jgi:hypothetical protein
MPFRHRLFNITLALAVAAFVLPFPDLSSAQEQQNCAPMEYFTPVIERMATFRILDGERRDRAIEIYNGEDEPVAWQSAYIAIREDGWLFLMVGMDSTVCAYIRVEPGRVFQLLTLIDGLSV